MGFCRVPKLTRKKQMSRRATQKKRKCLGSVMSFNLTCSLGIQMCSPVHGGSDREAFSLRRESEKHTLFPNSSPSCLGPWALWAQGPLGLWALGPFELCWPLGPRPLPHGPMGPRAHLPMGPLGSWALGPFRPYPRSRRLALAVVSVQVSRARACRKRVSPVTTQPFSSSPDGDSKTT